MISYFLVVLRYISSAAVWYSADFPDSGRSLINDDDVYNNGDDGSIIGTPGYFALRIIVILIGICLSASLRQYYCNPAADSKEDEKDVEAPPPPTTTTGNNNNMAH